MKKLVASAAEETCGCDVTAGEATGEGGRCKGDDPVSRWSRRIWKLEKEHTLGTHAFRLPDGRVQQIRTKNLLDADAYEQPIPPLRSAFGRDDE
jgi:hypothetical protein